MLVVKKKSLVMGLLVVLLVITGYLNLVYNQSVLRNGEAVETSEQDNSLSNQDIGTQSNSDDENVRC